MQTSMKRPNGLMIMNADLCVFQSSVVPVQTDSTAEFDIRESFLSSAFPR